MYQFGESGRDAASGEQGLIDPVEEAEGYRPAARPATKMLRSYLKENLPVETFAGAGDVLEVEADHRRHAVVEQRIAELKSAGLAHLPSK